MCNKFLLDPTTFPEISDTVSHFRLPNSVKILVSNRYEPRMRQKSRAGVLYTFLYLFVPFLLFLRYAKIFGTLGDFMKILNCG